MLKARKLGVLLLITAKASIFFQKNVIRKNGQGFYETLPIPPDLIASPFGSDFECNPFKKYIANPNLFIKK